MVDHIIVVPAGNAVQLQYTPVTDLSLQRLGLRHHALRVEQMRRALDVFAYHFRLAKGKCEILEFKPRPEPLTGVV